MAGDTEPERPNEAEGGPVKTFLEHLEDFRWVLIKSIVALFLGMLVCLFAANHVVGIIKWPLAHAYSYHTLTNQTVVVSFGTNHVGNFQLTPEQEKSLNLGTNRFVAVTVEPLTLGTNRVLGWHVSNDPAAAAAAHRMNIELVNLSPAGGFVVAFQVGLYGGALLASPFIFYFVAGFVFPALKIRERKYVYHGLVIGVGLFLTGVAFCYFILMPVALAAAQMYSQWLGFGALQWRAEDYISFVCKFMLGMGLGFELPVVILTLVKIGVIDYQTLAKARRYMIVINLILGAVLTTPEPITQLVMFIPLQGLYEITVWIAWYWDRREKQRARNVEAGARP
ncbi:MAG TPA: twin-arginine translocase subunit TatC [Verrucomicrobiae bacterium]|nr:twin-arginine translocase subunit TatC [Verrucomicrobiae bacterium]